MTIAVPMERRTFAPICLVTEEADNKPTGSFPELARLVREIMGAMSTRVAQRKTGVSHSTIAAMLNGDKVGEGTITRFARGFGIDPMPLLAAAGLLDTFKVTESTIAKRGGKSDYIHTVEFSGKTENLEAVKKHLLPSREIERVPDDEYFQLHPDDLIIHAEGFRDLDEVNRVALQLSMEAAAKAFVDTVRASGRARSIGGGMSPEEKKAEQKRQDDFDEQLDKEMEAERLEREARRRQG